MPLLQNQRQFPGQITHHGVPPWPCRDTYILGVVQPQPDILTHCMITDTKLEKQDEHLMFFLHVQIFFV